MAKHDFIFSPGHWIGEGRITFSASPDRLRFYTKWLIEEDKDNSIHCLQYVEMDTGEERISNKFAFSNILPRSFDVELSSEMIGSVHGKGIIDEKTIAWEFRGHPDFEGFEVYELQDNGDYMMHAEYALPGQFRTIIDGRIWKKSTK
jgi:hypothetical protein